MRLPRMTTRRWMVAVAVVGLLLGGVRLKRRRDYFLSLVQRYTQAEQTWCSEEALLLKSVRKLDQRMEDLRRDEDDVRWYLKEMIPRVDELRRHAARMSRRATDYAKLARKYRRAALYPWLPVAPDPPRPR